MKLMVLNRISVECYAGARADECPRRIIIHGREHLIARLLRESVEESAGARVRTHCYRVLTDAGVVLEILHTGDDWYLQS
jgi:hypothetical protein